MTSGPPRPAWTTYAKAGSILAAAVAIVGGAAVVLAKDPGPSGGSVGMLLWGGASLLGGVLALRGGLQRFRERQLVRNTPTSTVRSIAVGDVEIEGTADPVDEPLVSPVTEMPACVWELEIERLDETGNGGSEWSTVLVARDHVRFHVDDGTGRVLVDPEDGELDVEDQHQLRVDEGDPAPGPLVAWAEDQAWDEDAGEARAQEGIVGDIGDAVATRLTERARLLLSRTHERARRFTERVLAAGEEAYVFGGAVPREDVDSADNAENLVVGVHAGTGSLMLSDHEEADLTEDKLVDAAALVAVSVVFVPLGLAGLAMGLGLL